MIYASGDIAYKQLKDPAVMEKLKQLIENVTGIRVNLDVRHESVKPEIPDQQDLSSLFKNINMNIETEEV